MGAALCFTPQMRKVVVIIGIAFLVGINILHGRQSIRLYLNGVEVAPNNATETKNIDSDGRTFKLPARTNNTIAKAAINDTDERKPNLPGRRNTNIPHYENTSSPACKPHFLVANRPNQPLKWSNFSKFKRFYFHHSRKAGGTSIKYYMEKVAKHHGLQFVSTEFEGSEVPGLHPEPTFYATHLREPVARSISHFKYEGRWDCKKLTGKQYNASEENANTLESWVGDPACKQTNDKSFYLVKCATNCYIQWFSRLSCPSWGVSIDIQAEKANAVLHRFNIIIILEKLKDPEYVSAIEDFFGVPGLSEEKSAWCESASHQANGKFPLEVNNTTLQLLTDRNKLDIDLYNNISNCLEDGIYDFPKWNGDRFASNDTLYVHHEEFSKWKIQEIKLNWEKRAAKENLTKAVTTAKDNTEQSSACKPHFNLASAGGWDNKTKFTRLYFYHSRKAGGSSLRYYFEKVARHHGLEYAVTEYEKAEDPGLHDKNTFYVTNLREPVSRSISGFKYEGRWECNQLIYNTSFIPTEDNANKIETWKYTGGHVPMSCKFKTKSQPLLFFLGGCAVNCFIQWFSGKCPIDNIPWSRQYELAKEKLLRYNFIVVLEKMKDPNYVTAVEDFFGVPGITKKKTSLCEPEAARFNKKYPLVIQNETLANLKNLNQLDSKLYRSLTDCLDSGEYKFPKWNEDRFFTNTSIQVSYLDFDRWTEEKKRNYLAEKLGQ